MSAYARDMTAVLVLKNSSAIAPLVVIWPFSAPANTKAKPLIAPTRSASAPAALPTLSGVTKSGASTSVSREQHTSMEHTRKRAAARRDRLCTVLKAKVYAEQPVAHWGRGRIPAVPLDGRKSYCIVGFRIQAPVLREQMQVAPGHGDTCASGLERSE